MNEYNYIFKYLQKIINNKSVLIYGEILENELKFLKNNKISIVDENLDGLIKLKKIYPDIDFNQSLYFIKEKFDFLILLSDSPISHKDYLKDTGIFINIQFINNQEEYHKLILTENKQNFEFIERVNLYKKDTVIGLINSKNAVFEENDLFNQIPDVIIEFYSDFKLDIKNTVNLI